MNRPPAPDQGGDARGDARGDAGRFRATLVRVMAVQAITLVLLWLLQSGYTA
jgi:hypothetical protein